MHFNLKNNNKFISKIKIIFIYQKHGAKNKNSQKKEEHLQPFRT